MKDNREDDHWAKYDDHKVGKSYVQDVNPLKADEIRVDGIDHAQNIVLVAGWQWKEELCSY